MPCNLALSEENTSPLNRLGPHGSPTCMGKYIYWTFVFIVMGLGLYLVTASSLVPRDETKLVWTEVSQPEEFGVLVFQKTRQEVQDSPLLFLGVTPNQVQDLQVWKSFLQANQATDSKYDLVMVDPRLPYIEMLPVQMKIDVKDDMDRFVAGIRKAQVLKKRVVVIVPTIYSSQLLPGNPVNRLRQEFSLNFTSFSITPFPMTSEQEKIFEPRCSVDHEDSGGTGPLGCEIRSKARHFYAKKRESGKYAGTMDQIGPADDLILFNRN